MDIGAWLRELGLDCYEQAFRDNQIDADILPKLTADDLKDIGVTTVGHRRKLLEAITALEPASAPQAELSALAEATPRARPAEAERRQLTVLFCDLVGSTELAARLDPEDLREVMRAYQAACADVVGRFEGHVARFLGDGVLAYFGWPRAHEDDAERAVRAGLQLVQDVVRLEPRAEIRLQARVGVATGHVVVGDLISGGVSDRDAVSGETPNLAARLQAVAAPAGVVISPSTRRLVGGLFELTDLGPQRLKGFAEPVSAWQVEGQGSAEGRFEVRQTTCLTPLVGREGQITLLLRRWRQAQGGEGHVVLLSGEPGIGKSRLVRELGARLEDEPHIRLLYQCSPYHMTSPLHPVIEQLERAANLERDDPPEARLAKLEALLARGTDKLDQAMPLIAPLLGISTGECYPVLELTPQHQKQLTLEALLDQLAGLAAQQPVLLAYEDVQWIDPTTQELLGLAIERVQHLPVLLIITFRPGFTPPWSGQPHVSALALARLGRREGATMVEGVVGAKTLPAEVSAQIVARTDGVPLFVEELTKTVLESGLLQDAGDRYLLKGPLPAVAIPATLNGSLMARLDRLDVAKEVAQIGAVIGREFSYELLVAVTDRSVDEIDAALRRLIDAELILRRSIRANAVYAFKHALVRDAAYESLLKRTRQRLHARIATALEQHFQKTVTAHPALVAHHYAQARLIREAVPYYLQAGRDAVMRSATIEATDQLKAGLTLLEAYPDGPERHRLELGLQIALGDALRAAKGSAVVETGAAYARARTLAMLLDAKAELIRATHGEFNFHFNRAELNKARETAGSLIEVANELGEIETRSTGLEAAGLVAFSSGNLLSARAFLEKVLSIGNLESEPTLATYTSDAASMSYLSWALLILGYPQQAQRRCQQALKKGESSKQPFTLALALANSCYLHHLGRNWSTLRRNCRCLIDLASERIMPGWLETGLAFRGLTLAQRGQLTDGIRLIKYSLAEASSTRFVIEQPYFLSHLAEAYSRAGRFGEAFQTINDALERVALTGERWFEAELHRLKGEFALRMPAPDKAMADDCLRGALGIAKDQSARWWELRAATPLARLWADQGRRAEARDLLAPVYDWFTEGFDTPDLKDAKALLDELA